MNTFTVSRAALVLISVLLISACGGGGGSSASGSDSLNVTPGNLTFNANKGSILPAAKTLSVTFSEPEVAGVVVGYPIDIPIPSWLNLSVTGNNSPLTINVSVNSTALTPGVYETTIRVITGTVNSTVISQRDIPVTYTVTDNFDTSPAQLIFNSILGIASLPSSQTIQISGSQSNWTASSNQSWLTLDKSKGIGEATILATVNPSSPTSLSAGTHTAEISIVDSTSGANIIIPVNYLITPPNILSSKETIDFSAINGATMIPEVINFGLSSGQITSWNISGAPSWLKVTETSNGVFSIQVDAATINLESGSYSANINVTTTVSGSLISKVIPVSLILTPATLTLSSAPLTLLGTQTSDFENQVVTISLNTGTNSFPWVVTLNNNQAQTWLSADVTSGLVNSTSTPITLTIDANGLDESDYSGDVSITATVNGDTLTKNIPVALQFEPHRLSATKNGVSLLSLPGVSKLTHAIDIISNREITTNWSAISDKSWLSVTPSGLAGSSLSMNADTTGLATDTIHYATITLSSTTASVINSGEEKISVGLYVGSQAFTQQITASVSTFVQHNGLISDPIRPYVYVTHGGADVQVYNVFSGTLVNTISNVGIDLRKMTISGDGKTLYVLDHFSLGIIPIDLSTLQAGAIFSPSNWSSCNSCSPNNYQQVEINYARVNGRGFLIAAGPQLLDADTGDILYGDNLGAIFASNFVTEVSGDGKSFYFAATGVSSHIVIRREFKYSERNNTYTMPNPYVVSHSVTARGFSSNYDGSKLYRACWHPDNTVEVYNGKNLQTITAISSGTNGGALIGDGGTLFCARYYSDFSSQYGSDVWLVNTNTGIITSEFNVAGEVNPRQFVLSSNELRMITRSNNNTTLTFTTVSP